MIGDQAPTFGRPGPPGPPHIPGRPGATAGLLATKGGTTVPWIRGFKISDNQSPIPQDRVFFSFNYYNNVNYALNQRLQTPISGIQVYRYQLGLEKTFLNGNASIGLRDSLNNLSAVSPVRGLGGTSSAVGDLNLFTKFVLWQRWEGGGSPLGQNGNNYMAQGFGRNGGLFTGGLALTLPTGSGGFAGAPFSRSFHDTAFQPFVGYYFSRGRFYIQGFEAINVPTDENDVTIMYHDLGVGYFAYRNPRYDTFITGFAPTGEIHVNTPFNHHGVYSTRDFAGTPTVVDLTLGGNVQFGRRTVLMLGAVTPVTGPRPYSIEAVALLNVYFGGRRVPPLASGYPMQ
jgi:hypothetical protein